MLRLRDLELANVAIGRSATFGEAADALLRAGVAAAAIVDEEGRVVGLFTQNDLLAGLFPRYLAELHHTAFVPDDFGALAERARAVAREGIEHHMRKPTVVGADTSLVHAAEVFLHCECGALPVVEDDGRFVGMLSQAELSRRLQAELGAGA